MRQRVLLAFAIALVACGNKKAGDAQPEAKAEASSQAPAGAESQLLPASFPHPRNVHRVTKADAMLAPVHGDSPELKDVAAAEYPEEGVKAIDPSCTKPWVVLASAKGGKVDAPVFATIGQALYANPAFKVADAEPHSGGELTVEIHKKDDAFAVARCHDAGTCTRLAAMVKAVTKGDAPETGCGDLPHGLGPTTRVRAVSPCMPREGDTVGLCARLGACKLTKDPASSEDPIGACQKSPSSFSITCALKSSCDDVVECCH